MKIKLDNKHFLNSDEGSYWITAIVQAEKPHERRVSGYTATFSEAVDTFIEKRIKTAEIDNFTKLVKMIDEMKKEVAEWRCAVERGKTVYDVDKVLKALHDLKADETPEWNDGYYTALFEAIDIVRNGDR